MFSSQALNQFHLLFKYNGDSNGDSYEGSATWQIHDDLHSIDDDIDGEEQKPRRRFDRQLYNEYDNQLKAVMPRNQYKVIEALYHTSVVSVLKQNQFEI